MVGEVRLPTPPLPNLQECSDTPGFIHNVRGGTADSSRNTLDFESFRHICFKWHFKITKVIDVTIVAIQYRWQRGIHNLLQHCMLMCVLQYHHHHSNHFVHVRYY